MNAQREGGDDDVCATAVACRGSDTAMNLPPPDPAFRWSAEPWGYALRCRALESVAQHAFTTKQLKLRHRPPAPADDTLLAWTQAAASVGAGLDQVMRVKQVHGRTVRVLRRGEVGALDAQQRPEADALVSNQPDLVLVVQTADCVPLLIADRARGAAAAVHAGWRGTCAGIAPAVVETMSREFGSRPADLVVAMGPSIGLCCYQVGAELEAAFRHSGAADDRLTQWFTRDDAGALRLDLWTANTDQLVAAGVPRDQIYLSRLCTQTHADILDSYRVEKDAAGRSAALIRVPRS